MRRTHAISGLALAFLLTCLLAAASGAAAQAREYVTFTTSKGSFVVELYPDKAPATVANFLAYVQEGFYDGLVFHRVINGFMIQGGGMDKDLKPRQGRPPIRNEADNGLKNEAYTIAMARTMVPDSATSQFFVNVKDNRQLDHVGKTPSGWGYAVFGKVVEGREVVDAIKAVPTGSRGGMADVPVEAVTILKAQTTKR